MANRAMRSTELEKRQHAEMLKICDQVGVRPGNRTPSGKAEARLRKLLLDRADADERAGDTLDVLLGLPTERRRSFEIDVNAAKAAKYAALAAIGSLVTAVLNLALSVWAGRDAASFKAAVEALAGQ